MTKGAVAAVLAGGAAAPQAKPQGKKKAAAKKKPGKKRAVKKIFRITSGGTDVTYMKKLIVGKNEHYILRCNGGGRIVIDYIGVKNGGMLTCDKDDPKVEIKKLHCEPGAMVISKKF